MRRDRAGVPSLQLLSNGHYHVMVTREGTGFSRCEGMAVSRWREDATRDGLGQFCYLRDASGGRPWSATTQPTGQQDDLVEAAFKPGRATLLRRHVGGRSGVECDIECWTDIAVAPEDDIELRRVSLTNHLIERDGGRAGNRDDGHRTLTLTSYCEPVLEAPGADAAHPAFEKLFVQTEILRQWQAIVCMRRSRAPDEATPWMFHLLLPSDRLDAEVSYETDRMRFIGRGRTTANPQALDSDAALSGTAGAVLDPVAAIRCRVELRVGQAAVVDLISGVAASRDECLALIRRCCEPGFADRVLVGAQTRARQVLADLRCTEAEARVFAELAAPIFYADAAIRAPADVLALNQQGQSGLWRFAISGDLPIVLLGVDDLAQIDCACRIVQAHAYWRLHGLVADLVILVSSGSAPTSGLRASLLDAIASSDPGALIDKPGGIFVVAADEAGAAGKVLLRSVARVVLYAGDGPLHAQLETRRAPGAVTVVARQAPTELLGSTSALETPALAARELVFDNGFGGFTLDGGEYVITMTAARMTPLPWINVLANPSFGTLVSESGSASTWSENAQQFHLTPWSNDPVSDANTEAFYIRDEDSGCYWSPTLLPAPAVALATGISAAPYVTRHGFGYSVFEHTADGIASELTMFVAIAAPIKFVVLKLRNASNQARRLSVTGYVEWVLGDEREKTAMHVGTAVDAACGAMFARNRYNTDFSGRTAFFDADAEGADPAATSVCGDRRVFVGRSGSLREPDAMLRPQLCGTVGFALDPCAAIRLPVEMPVGQTRVLVFRLGAGATTDEARQLVQRSRGPKAALDALAAVKLYWTQTLGAVQVQAPDRSLDILANGWLVYQTLSCRLWARTALYQASGAFGFRDQLQDVMALVHAAPALVREHLLRSASRQFPEGDVQHWWHQDSGRGVRTRCSDDYLWLPLATARHVQVTDDTGVLDEPVHFVDGPPLKPGEVSCYDLPAPSLAAQPLYEHCQLAIEHGLRFGAHGLPLMGSCDWNDGMNLVGVEGKGESVWLGFFLGFVLTQFGELARRRDDDAFAGLCSTEAAHLGTAIEASAWDGAWYRRAWFDDGSPLGTAGNTECRIDSVAQSWAVLSGVGDVQRSQQAMDALDRMLVDRDAHLIRLLDPPFDHSDPSPGYIQGYVRGVRENGGQYTHAAVWAAMAFAAQGDSQRAWELFDMLNPIQHAKSAQVIDVYQAEPYVVAGDVYALPPHVGRGGWSWYTGSSGWLYRLILESLLGLQVEADTLRLCPSLPPQWDGYTLSDRHRTTLYRIHVMPRAAVDTSASWTVDGWAIGGNSLHLIDDGAEHTVLVRVVKTGDLQCRSA